MNEWGPGSGSHKSNPRNINEWELPTIITLLSLKLPYKQYNNSKKWREKSNSKKFTESRDSDFDFGSYLSETSIKILNWINRSIATLCLVTPSASTHCSSNLPDTGPSKNKICTTYFFAKGGNDLTKKKTHQNSSHLLIDQ